MRRALPSLGLAALAWLLMTRPALADGRVSTAQVAEAVRWLEAGRPAAAAEVFAGYLAHSPHERRVRRLLGDALLLGGHAEEARRAYGRVLAEGDDDAEAEAARRGLAQAEAPVDASPGDAETTHRVRISTLERAGRPAEALAAAREAVAELGERGGFRMELARLALDAERFEEAATQLRALARCDEAGSHRAAPLRARLDTHRQALTARARAGDLDAALAVSRLLVADDAAGEAVALYQALARRHPTHAGVQRRLAELQLHDGRPDEALATLEALVRASDDDLVHRLERARLLAWTERHAAARAEVAALDALAPGDARVALLRAWLDLWSGDEAAALTGFRAALARGAEDPEAADQVALLAGDHEAVLARWRRLHRLDPTDRARTLALADLLTRLGRHEEALGYYAGHLQHAPRDRRARLAHARALQASHRHAEAVATLKQLVAEAPDRADALTAELARAHLWAGEYEAARALFRTLAAREPQSRAHLLGMARACAWAGAHADARLWYAMALALDPEDAEALAEDAASAQALATPWEEAALAHCPVAEADQPAPAPIRPPSPRSRDAFLREARGLLDAGRLTDLMALYQSHLGALPADHEERRALGDFGTLLARLRAPAEAPPPACGVAAVPPPRARKAPRPGYDDLIAERLRRRADVPDDVANLVALGDLQARAGDRAGAASMLGEAVELAPDDLGLRLRLAFLLYGAGDYRASVPHLRVLHARRPERPCLGLYLAQALDWSGPGARDPAEVAALYRAFAEVRRAPALWPAIARLHHEAGAPDAAADAWRRALASRPGDSRARRGLALALVEAGRLGEASVAMDAAGDPALLQALIGRLEGPGPAARQARRLVERHLERHPADDALRLELARALARNGELDAAYGHFDAWRRRHPDDVAVTLEVVGLLSTHKAWDPALSLLDDALARQPGELALRKARADVLWWRGSNLEMHRPAMRAAWEAYLAERPDDGPTRLALARLHAQEADHEAVDRLLADWRVRHPFDHEATRLHGEALLQLGRPAEAVAPLEQAAHRAPDDVPLAVTLIHALHGAGAGRGRVAPLVSRVEARHRAGTLTPDERLALARLLVTLDRPAEAVPVFEAALQSAPPNAPVRLELAWLCLSLRRTDRALELLRPLVATAPEMLDARLALAHALAGEGDGEAAEHYRRYLSEKPSAAAVRLALADTLARQGPAEPALAEYRRVAEDSAAGEDADPDLARRARLALARTLLAADRAPEARAEAEALLQVTPGDGEAALVRAAALAVEGDRAAAWAALSSLRSADSPADPAVRAEARRLADDLERSTGPRVAPTTWLHADSDDLIEWGAAVEAAHRFLDFRTTLGARYAVASATQDEPLRLAAPDGARTVEIAPAGTAVVHTLLATGRYRLRPELELGAAAGLDVVREAPVADLALDLRYTGRGPFASYQGWRRALYGDVRASAVLDAADTALWQRLEAGWRFDGARVEAHYQNGLLSDGNVAHFYGGSATWAVTGPLDGPTGLQLGLLVDGMEWASPSVRYWTPTGGLHARGAGRYALALTPDLTAALDATLGFFREGARGPFTVTLDGEPLVFTREAASALTYSLAPGLRARLAEGLALTADLLFAQSGPGLTSARYRSLRATLAAEVLW